MLNAYFNGVCNILYDIYISYLLTIDIMKVDKQLTHAMHVKIDMRMALLSIH